MAFTLQAFNGNGRGDFQPFYLPHVESFSGVKISLEVRHVSNPDTLKAAKGKDGELKASLGYTSRPPSPHSPAHTPQRVWNASGLMSG